MNKALYQARRLKFAQELGEGTLALIPGAKLAVRNNDNHYPFRQDSDFLYLTGFSEPDALLLIVGGSSPRSILFSLPKDPEAELWTGERLGQAAALTELGVDEAISLAAREEMDKRIMRLLSEARMFAYPPDRAHEDILACIKKHRQELKRDPPIIDVRRILGEMRLRKCDAEVRIMRRAGEISGLAHRDILSFVCPGMREYEVEAKLTHAFRSGGGDPLHAYPPIVASGINACILHYTKNDAVLKDGELLLIDAGCELSGYASDITRTFPVSGVWSKEQRALYMIVLGAQEAAIKSAHIGVPLGHLHRVARRHIVKGLLELNIIEADTIDEAIDAGLDRQFFPHGTSHWLGIDVHDAGDYERSESTKLSERRLAPGMVITVEPGLYMRSKSLPHEYRDIGIRIEDDVLITKNGPLILSYLAPKDPDEIEAIMQAGSF